MEYLSPTKIFRVGLVVCTNLSILLNVVHIFLYNLA